VNGYHWLSFGYGLAGFLLGAALWVIWRRGAVTMQKDRLQAEALDLLRRRLDLQSEQIEIDQQLADLWQRAPEPRARWIVSTVDQARMLAPRLHELAWRFGFAVPSPEVVQAVHNGSAPSSEEPSAPPPSVAPINAWGKRRGAA